jgi:hypothetical protein
MFRRNFVKKTKYIRKQEHYADIFELEYSIVNNDILTYTNIAEYSHWLSRYTRRLSTSLILCSNQTKYILT